MTTVLLVDDSPTILMSMSAILTKTGFAVATATDGQDALDRLATLTPDLVISDLNMPRMDGMAFLQQVRRLPGLRFVPVLILTTESDQTRRQQAKAAGATGWLVKPVAPQDLVDVIRRVVPGA